MLYKNYLCKVKGIRVGMYALSQEKHCTAMDGTEYTVSGRKQGVSICFFFPGILCNIEKYRNCSFNNNNNNNIDLI